MDDFFKAFLGVMSVVIGILLLLLICLPLLLHIILN